MILSNLLNEFNKKKSNLIYIVPFSHCSFFCTKYLQIVVALSEEKPLTRWKKTMVHNDYVHKITDTNRILWRVDSKSSSHLSKHEAVGNEPHGE